MLRLENNEHYETARAISFLSLIALWLITPFLLWLFLVVISCFMFNYGKHAKFIFALISISLATYICTRYVGLLWAGSDDMPSYFLAYLNYDELKWLLNTSVRFARHADPVFSLYSWGLAQVTNKHLFLYYLVTVLLSYLFVWKFLRSTKTPHILIAFLLIVTYFKFFQFQWHLIRAMMAVPIILLGLMWLAEKKALKGKIVYLIGGLTHFSSFALSLPLFVLNKRLNKVYSPLILVGAFFAVALCVVFLLLSAKFLANLANFYIVSKVVARLTIAPSFSMVPFLAFFMVISAVIYPVYARSRDTTYIRLYNISYYFISVGAIAVFIAGQELYRFIMPLFVLYSPLLLKSLASYKQRVFVNSAVMFLLFMHLAAFTYVLRLNESKFFYKYTSVEPLTVNGVVVIQSLSRYVNDDIGFYSGYRQ